MLETAGGGEQRRIDLGRLVVERRFERRDHGVEPRLRAFVGRARADAGGRALTGVTTAISSRAVSKTTITVGRTSSASGTPIGSGFAGGSRSMRRTMS